MFPPIFALRKKEIPIFHPSKNRYTLGTVQPYSQLTEFDIALFQTGKHFRLYEKLGSRCVEHQGVKGVYFAVWAPNAKKVSLIGDFNKWNVESHVLFPRLDSSGVWEGFVADLGHGTVYKYHIKTHLGPGLDKGDPFAIKWETPPKTASMVWDTWYEWNDQAWLEKRKEQTGKAKPWSVYEVHAGSWKKMAKDGNRSLNYRELATDLVEYVKEMGFSHVELMPIMEHPYFPSWGYQITGYFAPSSRFGTPQDLMFLIESFHAAGIGVILDWVPSHFPSDIHGLYFFDGTHLFEYADPKRGYHHDWNSYIFDYGRPEVRSFLISNALFWMDRYHIDGVRVDAVASMLYHDYSRNEGEWIPNKFGGRENLEAISLFKEFNDAVHLMYPGVETIAEESTAFPGVTSPTEQNGLGFDQKWMMGWMHDNLRYFQRPMPFRRWHQNDVSFSFVYAWSEKFMLPLSHDEVVHLKASLLTKMPGDEFQRFANLRLLLGFQWMHPGSQLLFMGGEIGQLTEWSHDAGVQWDLLEKPKHKGVQDWVKALNHFYSNTTACWEKAFDADGFEWVSGDDTNNSVLVFLRKGRTAGDVILVVCHFAEKAIESYTAGVPFAGTWTEVLNSDASVFGGSDLVNKKAIKTEAKEVHGRSQSISFDLAPLAIQVFIGKEKKKRVPSAKALPLAKKANTQKTKKAKTN